MPLTTSRTLVSSTLYASLQQARQVVDMSEWSAFEVEVEKRVTRLPPSIGLDEASV